MFLAISGLMMMIVFLGVSTSISRTRFHDGVRTIQSLLQQTVSDSLSGVNLRDGTTMCAPDTGTVVDSSTELPGRSKCILLGKVMTFVPGAATMRVYDVVGQDPIADSSGKSSDEVLKMYNPKVVTRSSLVTTQQLPGGVVLRSACTAEAGLVDEASDVQLTSCKSPLEKVNAYMVLRSPTSGESKSYVFDTGTGNNPDAFSAGNILQKSGGSGYVDFYTGINPNPAQASANLCFDSAESNRVALLRVGGQLSASQSAITAAFDLSSADIAGACQT